MRQALLALSISCASAVSAQLPAVDIWTAHITESADGIQLTSLTNITQRKGYDNQPSFSSDGKTILYTSIRDEKQADIYAYDIQTATTTQITNTVESEYSPVLMENDKSFLTVRVEQDSTQRLWMIRMKDGKAKLFIPGVDSIGYYCMVNENAFSCFMVTDTPSLMLVDRKKDGGRYIAQNIGRCIKLFPHSTRITYLTKDTEKVWTIRSYDYVSREFSVITEVPATVEDFVWTDFSHRLLMARGNAIWMYDTTVSRAGWVKACEIPSLAGKNIYRMALSPDGKTLAFVADE